MTNNIPTLIREKPNFVMCLGVGGGKHTLQGLMDYLSEFFNVYTLELPGFGWDEKPFSNISIKSLSANIKRRLEQLNLENYILAGFSLGFRIVNELPLNKKCVGIVAVEPYTSSKCLNLSLIQKKWFFVQMDLVRKLKLDSLIWKSSYFRNILIRMYRKPVANVILNECDPQTFFKVGMILLEDSSAIKFYDCPYVIIAPENDEFINSDWNVNLFRQNVKKLLVLRSKTEHYPANADKAYFESRFPREGLYKLANFFDKPF
jgi:pimeloyl-ACP methyl ester carboxylesterase